MGSNRIKFSPILFSAPMVVAIMEDRKTMTRRTVKVDSKLDYLGVVIGDEKLNGMRAFGYKTLCGSAANVKPKYSVADVLWVRETYAEANSLLLGAGTFSHYVYKADDNPLHEHFKWKPSIFMPKAACRLFLKVTGVRVERLQEISEKDAVAEGLVSTWFSFRKFLCYQCESKNGHLGVENLCDDGFFDDPKAAFRSLWCSINGGESWQENPYVWVVGFERCERPDGWS